MSRNAWLRDFYKRKMEDSLSEFGVLVSYRFQKHIQSLAEAHQREEIYECVQDLIESREDWRRRRVKKPQQASSTGSIKMAAVNKDIRLIFSGPLRSKNYSKPTLFIHDFCNHDKLDRCLRQSIRDELDNSAFVELDPGNISRVQEYDLRTLSEDVMAFAKPIPPLYFADTTKIDTALKSEKMNICLTEKQLDTLLANRPVLIHGEAGTGKTTVLCHRLALSILNQRDMDIREPILYLSYNQKLVEQAKKDIREILREVYGVDDDISTCEFISFRDFLKGYVPNPDFFKDKDYVPFGRFKRLYEIYSRGQAVGVGSPEFAWYVIRSVLKGSCIPPDHPPISRERYEELGRNRQEIEPSQFDSFYRTGAWYQTDILKKKGLWDDQDLAWTAYQWIQKEIARNSTDMKLYSEIFCDEIQDLTELEFKILLSLCQPTTPYALESISLVLAGDPLQTINPTGFRWSVLRSDIYRVEGEAVKLYRLQENWRSDHRIVKFSNIIKKIRAFYMKDDYKPQSAFKKEGDCPIFIYIQKDNASTILETLTRNCQVSSSAVILWAEEMEVEEFINKDPLLKKLSQKVPHTDLDKKMADLHLYTVSDAKGLEFLIVILYKFGEHPEVKRWWNWMQLDRQPSQDDSIPLLYFLNRLYVSITRAQSYLLIIDTLEAIDKFWRQWEEVMFEKSADGLRKFIEQKVTLSPHEWEEEGDKQFEHAEKTKDIRHYERALASYRKAKANKKAIQIEAQIATLKEEWESAGNLYLEINEEHKAATCFEKGEKWKRAIEVYKQLPSGVWRNRALQYCRFRNECSIPLSDCRKAILDFSNYVQSDEGIQKEYIWEVANKLFEFREYAYAGRHFEHLYRQHNEGKAGVEAGRCWRRTQEYDKAIMIFRECNFYETEFVETLQEKAQFLERQGSLQEASDTYGDLGRWRRDAYLRQGLCLYRIEKYSEALDAFLQAKYSGGDIFQTIRLFVPHKKYDTKKLDRINILPYVAVAHYQLKQYEDAESLFRMLIGQGILDEEQRNNYYSMLGDCQLALGQKQTAYESYRRGKIYDKALFLVKELKRPEQEIKQLQAAEAEKQGNFEKAISIHEELGDQLKVVLLRGHQERSQGKYMEAIAYYTQANKGQMILECIKEGRLSHDKAIIALRNALLSMSDSDQCTLIRTWIEKPPTRIWKDEDPQKFYEEFINNIQKQIDYSLNHNEYETAIRAYEELMLWHKHKKEAGIGLGRLLYQLERYTAAIQAFEKVGYHGAEYDFCIDKVETLPEELQGLVNSLKAALELPQEDFQQKQSEVLDWIDEIREICEVEGKAYRILSYIGEAYEKLNRLRQAAYFYEKYQEKVWAREGWIRVQKTIQRQYQDSHDYERAERINRKINLRLKEWEPKSKAY